jgi:hypothetical protein
MVKSYRDVSIILIRYFICILPVLIMVVAIGLDLIRDKMIRNIVLASILLFSLLDIFVVKNYYNSVSKTQLREVTDEIREKNKDNALIVCHWSWIFPYFFQDMPQQKFEQKTLEEYVHAMQNGEIQQIPFWYADANWRPYALNAQDDAYLKENFIERHKIEFFDAWANFYVPKSSIGKHATAALVSLEKLALNTFSPANFDGSGNIVLFNNANVKSPDFEIQKGSYNMIINGKSLPEKPIENQHAHFRIKVNGKEIGQFFMTGKPSGQDYVLPFKIDEDQKIQLELVYDNDLFKDGLDRNAMISGVRIEKN